MPISLRDKAYIINDYIGLGFNTEEFPKPENLTDAQYANLEPFHIMCMANACRERGDKSPSIKELMDMAPDQRSKLTHPAAADIQFGRKTFAAVLAAGQTREITFNEATKANFEALRIIKESVSTGRAATDSSGESSEVDGLKPKG